MRGGRSLLRRRSIRALRATTIDRITRVSAPLSFPHSRQISDSDQHKSCRAHGQYDPLLNVTPCSANAVSVISSILLVRALEPGSHRAWCGAR